ncbi:MAG TPA: hypothetical protein VGS28_02270 [Candidatus Saccharimonadales bacterium]|nr:hypothetical protein [Candidatus Saccharimonadales bacterium]
MTHTPHYEKWTFKSFAKRNKTASIVMGLLLFFVVVGVVGSITSNDTKTNSSPPGGIGPTISPSNTTQREDIAAAESSSANKPTPTTKTTATPRPVSTPKVLLNMSGNGIQNSAPFLVSTSQLTVIYSYDCSSDGGSGNFIADLEYGIQSSNNSDDQTIANALGSGATNITTTIYPQDPGHNYYLAVNSECGWSVTVTSE